MQRTSPDDIRHLERAEHLLLWAFRATVFGHADCPALHRGFGAILGEPAGSALGHLLVLVRTLGHAGRRRFGLHIPGCLCVSQDERMILALFASAQQSIRTHDERAVRIELTQSLPAPLIDGALLSLQSVAAALEAGGLRLPLRGLPLHEGDRASVDARTVPAGVH